MVQSGSAAEATGVQTAQQKALALAQLEASRAQVSLGQVSLQNHRLLAPFAGSITRAPEGVGGVVGAGTPLFEIVNLKALKLKCTLGEHDASLVTPGAKLTIETEQGVVEGKVNAVLGSVLGSVGCGSAEEQSDDSIFLIPVRLQACDVPERLRRWQWVNLFAVDGYDRLVTALQARALALGRSPLHIGGNATDEGLA